MRSLSSVPQAPFNWFYLAVDARTIPTKIARARNPRAILAVTAGTSMLMASIATKHFFLSLQEPPCKPVGRSRSKANLIFRRDRFVAPVPRLARNASRSDADGR